ncbi:hypothetical protein PHAVU_010G162800 [Phaseolus vulgaris]|uniref:Uncharacterized protein n=1 Tax=Phaseolus vulgaris TaxID=3885 RepID=V7AUD9_PHAVU|nr:hypothetical protein PHAVU_010G162800g [Phaseolus vulgaris]ESW07836.1 hypothetical protein PHAVU_010G162800g [Phaseolus vulgaris]
MIQNLSPSLVLAFGTQLVYKESPLPFPTMVVRFLVLSLLISGIHAISISEGKGLIQSNGEAQQLLGKLYGISMEEARILKEKVDETENGCKDEVVSTTRIAQGGSSGGGGKKGKTGTGGSADVTRRPRQSSAPSKPHFWVSTFNLCVSMAISVTLFPFHWI